MFARNTLLASVAASAASLAFCISIVACFLSVMSVATPSSCSTVPSGEASGIFITCSQWTRPSLSVNGCSGTNCSIPESITSRSSRRAFATSSSFVLKSASVWPISPSTVVP